MNRKQKEQIVLDLHRRFEGAKMVILTDFKGINVEAANALRSELRRTSVEYRVVKNTLLRLAAKGTPVESLRDHFSGPCAVVLSNDDPVVAAKILMAFSKEHPYFNVKVGVLNGGVLESEKISELSKLPSREVLLAKFLSCLCYVSAHFVGILNGLLIKFLVVIMAIKDKKATGKEEGFKNG